MRTLLVLVALTLMTSAFQVHAEREGKKRVLTPCDICPSLPGYVDAGQISYDIRKMVGKYRGGSGDENVTIQKTRGVVETGLQPDFINNGNCPEINSEQWAIDYTYKRGGRAALHKGIDIPQPRGTPVIAVANGMVVGRFVNDGNRKGIEVMLRHTPEQTGLPYWTYSQYTHLLNMSPLPVGTKVKMGDEIGKISNTGKMGRRVRRDALHFAILYSQSPDWAHDGVVVTPKDGYFMDPVAFYRDQPPYGTPSMVELPGSQKRIPVAYIKRDNTLIPATAKRIWPFRCK